jgi:hypothetical protein
LILAVTHGIWNGIDCRLFGFSENVGTPNISETHLYSSELGLLRIALVIAFFALIWCNKATYAYKIISHIH